MKNVAAEQHQGLVHLGLTDVAARVLIVGLGVTGLSVARFLSKYRIQSAIVDSREIPPRLKGLQEAIQDVAVFTGSFNVEAFEVATHIVVSPGVSLDQENIVKAAQRGACILGDIDIFAACADAPVACITGSNGKSTVTTLLGLMAEMSDLDVRVGGNLGTAALDLITEKTPDLYVLELSSFQLERTAQLNASVATVLNVSADHMDRYENIATYAKVKASIFRGNGAVVLNRADNVVMAMQNEYRAGITFGLDAPDVEQYGVMTKGKVGYLAKGDECLMPISELKLKGSHNIENAMAAIAMADILKIPVTGQKQALKEFAGLAHRTQWVAESNGRVWINDSKATNPGATLAAIEGLKGPIILIAGGDAKGADFSSLHKAIQHHVEHVVLIGQDAQRLKKQAVIDVSSTFVDSIEQAVELADKLAKQGDTILLSPACASLDQFANYQERGDRFVAAVERLQR